MDIDFARLVFAIAVMGVLFVSFAWGLSVWAKKRGIAPTKGERTLRLKETLYLDSRTKVCLIEQGDDVLTVALSATGTTLLNKTTKDNKKTED